MTKQPMWDDRVAPSAELARKPLDEDARGRIAIGDGLRIVTRRGVVYEGVAEKVRASSGNQFKIVDVWVGGVSFVVSQHTIYSIPVAELDPTVPGRAEPSERELRDTVTDLSRRDQSAAHEKPTAVSALAVARELLGFEPDLGRPNAAYGGKSPEGWFNEFISMGRLKKVMDGLVADGVLRKVTTGSYMSRSDDDIAVTFGYGTKTGYVLAEDYAESADRAKEAQRAARQAKLLSTARATIADRHADEVEAELARLLMDAR